MLMACGQPANLPSDLELTCVRCLEAFAYPLEV